jgi:hypothetical protein
MYHEGGLEVIGVNIDGRGDEQTGRRFAASAAMTYRVWLDPESMWVPASSVPPSYLVARDGTLLWGHLGVIRHDGSRTASRRGGCPRGGRRWLGADSRTSDPVDGV